MPADAASDGNGVDGASIGVTVTGTGACAASAATANDADARRLKKVRTNGILSADVLVHDPAFHHEHDSAEGGDVLQRIAVHGDDVGLHPRRERPDLGVEP